MQLDRTHVAIRLRTLSEIGDLAMVMIRRYPKALLVGFMLGALPWMVANALLLSWIPITEASYGLDDEEATVQISRYMAWMATLVFLQTPAAGVLMTLYLGQAVFEHQPTWSSVFAEARRQFKRWFLVLGIFRLPIPVMVLLAFRIWQPPNVMVDVFLLLGILLYVAVVRASRPFVPEILLLEQCPMRGSPETVITMSRRSKVLHTPMASDLGGRFMAVAFVNFWFLMSVLYTLIWFRGIATGLWTWDLIVLLLMYPLALWIVAGVNIMIRLLSYLDTRIRLEGWEVELAVRAEAMRQFGEEAGLVPVAGAIRSRSRSAAAESAEPQLAEVVSEGTVTPSGPAAAEEAGT